MHSSHENHFTLSTIPLTYIPNFYLTYSAPLFWIVLTSNCHHGSDYSFISLNSLTYTLLLNIQTNYLTNYHSNL